MKKFKIVALLLALCLGITMLVSCGGDGGGETPPCEAHVDDDKDGRCDVCDSEVEIVCDEHTDVNNDNICDVCREALETKVEYVITLNDENGEPVANVEITLNQYGEVIATGTTDSNGQIKGELDEGGKFTVIITELPENWYSNDNYSEITISKTQNNIVITAIDNTPNGSKEKPFPSENAETGEAALVVFPAGQTYNFTTKGAARYVIINNADAKLIYKGAEYLPDENGIIKVLFDATGVTSVTVFQIVNTKDSDNEIGLSFEAIKGTQSNPYEAVVGQEYTVNIEPEISVYYSFTADKDGVLLVKSPTSVNSITLYNKTSYVSTNATNGAGASYIPVKMGDKVDITVALIQNAEASEVSFTLEFFDGSEQNPIVIYEAATLKIGKGMSYFFKASTELDISLEISSSVNINVNGGEENTDLILKSSGSEVIEIANNTEENADVTIIVNIE